MWLLILPLGGNYKISNYFVGNKIVTSIANSYHTYHDVASLSGELPRIIIRMYHKANEIGDEFFLRNRWRKYRRWDYTSLWMKIIAEPKEGKGEHTRTNGFAYRMACHLFVFMLARLYLRFICIFRIPGWRPSFLFPSSTSSSSLAAGSEIFSGWLKTELIRSL